MKGNIRDAKTDEGKPHLIFALMLCHEARHEAKYGVADAHKGAVIENLDSVRKPAFQWTRLEQEYAT